MTQRRMELPAELVDRGIYWQVGGFTLVAVASTAILAEFAGSDSRGFLYFEIAVTNLYWALVIPLAGLFDGGRKLFEKMSDYRARRERKWLEEGRQEGRKEGRNEERERIREEMQRHGVALTPEAAAILFGETNDAAQ